MRSRADIKEYLNVIKTGEPFFVDDFIPVPDFKDTHLSVRAFKVGNGLGFISTDITERKKAEEEIVRMASIVKFSSDFIGVADLEGHALFLNDAGREMVGVKDDDDFLSTMLSDYFTDADREILEKQILPELMDSGRWTGEMHFRHFVTGEEIPVFFDIFRIDHPTTGQPLSFATVTRDITERKRAEKLIKVSENKYRRLVETMNEGLGIIDKEGRVTYVNNSLCKMLGYTADELIGKLSKNLYEAKNQEILNAQLKARRGGISKPYEIAWTKKNGDLLPTIMSPQALFDEAGDHVGSFVVVTDITSRKRYEGQIKDSLKEKDLLLKEIHHRVKNNLQIISSLLHLQSEKLANPEMAAVFIESQNRVKSMALLHENLYQSGNLSKIDVREYIKNLAAYLSQTYDPGSHGVSLTVDVDDVSLDMDTAIPLGLIVNELVTNALIHAFPDREGGQIKVELREGHEKHSLIVRDDGVGLLDTAEIGQTKTLGLELVNNLVDQLDGTLKVRSNPGAKFEIIF